MSQAGPLWQYKSFIRLWFARLASVAAGQTLFAVLLGGATALLPMFAKDILFVGPLRLGLLRGAPAIGALAMSLVLTRRPVRRRTGRLQPAG